MIANNESTQIAGRKPPLTPPGRGTEKTALVLSFLEITLSLKPAIVINVRIEPVAEEPVGSRKIPSLSCGRNEPKPGDAPHTKYC